MAFRNTAVVILLAVVLAGCTSRRPHFFAEAGYVIGPAEGRTQIPRSGSALTSSHGRPTLDELGVDVVTGPTLKAGARLGRHGVVVEAARLDLSGSKRLDEDLTTHGRFYAAGERLESDGSISRLRVTYQHAWPVRVRAGRLFLTGALGGAALNIDSRLKGESRFVETRSFTHLEPSFGVHARWWPNAVPPGLSFFLDADTTFGARVPITQRQAGVHEIQAGVSFHPRPWLMLNASAGLMQWELLDSQGFPNHVRVTVLPAVMLSGTFRF